MAEYEGPSEEEISRLYFAALEQLNNSQSKSDGINITASEHDLALKIIEEYDEGKTGTPKAKEAPGGDARGTGQPDDVAVRSDVADSNQASTRPRFDEAPDPPSGHFPSGTSSPSTTNDVKSSPIATAPSISSPPASSLPPSSPSPSSPSQQPPIHPATHAWNNNFLTFMPGFGHTHPPAHIMNATNIAMGMPPLAMPHFINPMMPMQTPVLTMMNASMVPHDFNLNNFQPLLNHTQQFTAGVAAAQAAPSLDSTPIETLTSMYQMMSGLAENCKMETEQVEKEVKNLKKKLKKAKEKSSKQEEKLQELKKVIRDAKNEVSTAQSFVEKNISIIMLINFL